MSSVGGGIRRLTNCLHFFTSWKPFKVFHKTHQPLQSSLLVKPWQMWCFLLLGPVHFLSDRSMHFSTTQNEVISHYLGAAASYNVTNLPNSTATSNVRFRDPIKYRVFPSEARTSLGVWPLSLFVRMRHIEVNCCPGEQHVLYRLWFSQWHSLKLFLKI